MGGGCLTDARGRSGALVSRAAVRKWAREHPERAAAFADHLARKVWINGRLRPFGQLVDALRRAHVAAGVCPACAYDLAGVPAAAEIVCPECGGVWEAASDSDAGDGGAAHSGQGAPGASPRRS